MSDVYKAIEWASFWKRVVSIKGMSNRSARLLIQKYKTSDALKQSLINGDFSLKNFGKGRIAKLKKEFC